MEEFLFNGSLPSSCAELANKFLDHKAEKVLLNTRSFGPSCVKELGFRLKLEQAEHICEILKLEARIKKIDNFHISPYDFPSTQQIWAYNDHPNQDYAILAFSQLFDTLAKSEKARATSITGFKKILPLLTQETFRSQTINVWGTRLSGLFSSRYLNKTSSPVLEIIDRLDRFKKIKAAGFMAYDLNQAPNGTWLNEDDSITQTSLDVTKLLIKKLSSKLKCSYRSVSGFAKILKQLSLPTFEKMPINIWGTTLSGMLQVVSKHSPSVPVLSLVKTDSEFTAIRKAGLSANDFPKSPNGTWKNGAVSKSLAREQVHKLILRLAAKLDVNPYCISGFKKLLPLLTETTLQKVAINPWGTTCASALAIIYDNSPSTAVLDLINNEPSFKKIKVEGLAAWDFTNCPNNYWLTPKGNPTINAKRIIGVALDKFYENQINSGLPIKIPCIKELCNVSINVWGTNCKSAFEKAYKGNLSKALMQCQRFC